ncbi:MAG TPA: septal ring lytic transglycosylase RlpA family protein [Devosiaceae bacterium]|nr:septal ring lytic transglycosylase RlpA family protein [Devosiaceae bacterium]
MPVSRRVTNNPNPPHGGGIRMVGDAYQVHGEWYKPKPNPVGYDVKGIASYYGWDFHGRLTANGEIFSANAITGGSPDLPLPCYARVTNLANGKSLLVRFNDRGPYMSGRVVDLSERAASLLGYANTGTAPVRVQYVSAAPLNGDDTNYLMASLTQTMPSYGGQETRLASVEPQDIRPVPMQPRAVSYEAPAPRSSDKPQMRSVLASVNSLFSFADSQEEQVNINSAHAAVDAMAARVPNLRDWVATTDDDARAVEVQLGSYEDPAAARRTAMQFAMLGAVDEDQVTDNSGAGATRLTLTHLKPGVARQDVAELAHKLGLKDVVLY